jgi:F-type H+-transporting ATPase subunit delta
MKISEVARRYAKAIMSIAAQKNQQLRAHQEIVAVAEALQKDPSVAEYFNNPLVPQAQKKAAVQAAFQQRGLLEEVYSLLLLLAEKNRFGIFDQVAGAFQEEMDASQGVTRGTVTSAKPMGTEARAALENQIHKTLNKKTILTYKEDSSLLGGVVAQVGGWTFDDSIETQLTKLNEELNRRAN